MAAGLAASGKIAFASSFAVFATGRAFEIIRNSICYPNLNVKICATHAGLSVGEDGASHQSIEDVAIMRVLPNMHVFVPCDQYETKAVIDHVAKLNGPCYVRLGRGKVEDVYNENTIFDFSKVSVLKEGKDVALFAMGLMVQEALKASEILKEKGINCSVINVSSIKPLDEEGIIEQLAKHKMAFVLEEHNIIGGLFGAIAEVAVKGNHGPIYPIGVNDTFGESGPAKEVLKKYGLTAEHIVEEVSKKSLL